MQELLLYPNWVLWRLEYVAADKPPTKVPYSPHTGKHASVSDPQTWAAYDVALAAFNNGGGYNGLGFMLSQHDPFAFIDLDDAEGDPARVNRQIAIATAFDSYSERSPSGRGLHIIVKGYVPSGRRRDKVEVYSYGRYMTVTGDVYENKVIADRQPMLDQLWAELGEGGINVPISVTEVEQKWTDEQIYEMALNSANGDRFQRLWNGDLAEYGGDQSRADFALIDIIGFYSRNIEQIIRMFHTSQLGQRQKAYRKDYLRKMVLSSFDNYIPDVNLDALKLTINSQITAMQRKPGAKKFVPTIAYTFPPGLMGEIASFIYQASPRPVVDIALVGAIGLMAGICGRAFNVSGTGLNQYVVLLAKTGVGKEAMSGGIDRIMRAVTKTVPSAEDFIGPADMASGQALAKYLALRSPCFVSIFGEFGIMLERMCAQNASESERTKRLQLLRLYNKSGNTNVNREVIHSDKQNNAPSVKAPAFSLIGESTPEAFYSNLDEFIIAQGLLPRFTVIDYQGGRVPFNKQHEFVEPPEQLIERVGALCVSALQLMQADAVINCMFDDQAQQFLDAFDIECDRNINEAEIDNPRQIWNRAHLKVMKLAALVAVGCNMYAPVVNLEMVQWAHKIVVHDAQSILARFDAGTVGNDASEQHQVAELTALIADYVSKPYKTVEKYKIVEAMHKDRVLPASYALNRLQQRNAFKKDGRGPSFAVRRAFDILIADGAIREVRPGDILSRYSKTAKCYAIVDVERFP